MVTTHNYCRAGYYLLALAGGRGFINRQYNPSDAWIKHGITKQKLVVELFRKFHGKLGFYLVNLKDKKYYYCGLTKKDIQNTLYAIGIGRKDNA